MKSIPVAALCAALASMAASAAPADGAASVRDLALTCAACHGADGNSPSPDFPIIAGQHRSYLQRQLEDYRDGRRHGQSMSSVAAALSQDQIAALGRFFSDQARNPVTFSIVADRAAAGRQVSDKALCTSCHMEGFIGGGDVPRLAGQWPQYISKALHDYHDGRRKDDTTTMKAIAEELSDQDIADVSQYIGSVSR